MFLGQTQEILTVVRVPKVDISELETTEAPVEPELVPADINGERQKEQIYAM